jgi:hypothetical protein
MLHRVNKFVLAANTAREQRGHAKPVPVHACTRADVSR